MVAIFAPAFFVLGTKRTMEEGNYYRIISGGKYDPRESENRWGNLIRPAPQANVQPGRRCRRLLVDNRDRISGEPFDFVVDLSQNEEEYRNISKIQVLGVSVPKVADEDYVLLSIAEIPHGQLDLVGNYAGSGSEVFYFDTSKLDPGDVKPIEGGRFCAKEYCFSPPLSQLSKLSIKVMKYTSGDKPQVITAGDAGGCERFSLLLSIQTEGSRP